jgi:hypothetical protein
VVAIAVLTSCAERQANDFLEIELTQPGTDQLSFAEVPIQSCFAGSIIAHDDVEESWRIQLEEEQGGIEVAVLITTPNGERLQGVLDEAEPLVPGFSGSGTADLRPDGDPTADPSTAQLAWLCD